MLIFSPISAGLKINNAQAILGAGDQVFDPLTEFNTGAIAANTAPNIPKTTFDFANFATKIAGQIFKKVILDRLVDALLAYINGQKDTIIDDWDQFFQQAGDDAVGLLAQQVNINGINLCNNFNLNLRFMLLPPNKFSERVTCSLSQIIGNIDSFLNNFENGGWVAYQEQWYPNNNFYGAAITALDEVALQSARAKDAAQSQGIAGGGFFSQVKCNPPGTNLNCKIVTPGSYIQDQVNALIGPKKDLLSIIGADDIAAYMGAIVNAGINRLSIMSIEGLQGALKKDTKSLTTTTPKAPCAGLSGDAFRACAGFQSISSNSYRSGQYLVQSQLNSSLNPRKEAASILTQLIASQTELVNSLSSLAACKPGNASTTSQLSEEQLTLDDLQNKFEDNKTFLDPLQQASDNINNGTNNDWLSLGNQAANTQPLTDPNSANNLLSSLKQEKQRINDNINSKLPGIKLQLQQCPQKIKPAS